MVANNNDFEKKLRAAADELQVNSKLKSSEYVTPVLGLIFLRFAGHKFSRAEQELTGKASGRNGITKTDYQQRPEAVSQTNETARS
jgi:type I restriction enzyme M protein